MFFFTQVFVNLFSSLLLDLLLLESLSSFSWTTISLVYQKTLQLSLFTCMRYLCMSFCSYICSSVVSFSLFVFLVSYTFVSLFLLLFSLSITSLNDKLKELLQIWKNMFVYLPFCWAFFFIFICLCTMLCEEPDCIFNETCDALLFSFTFFFL